MRHIRRQQTGRKTLITMAAAGGMLALGGGYAHADAGAGAGASGHAADSPGLLSGNALQAPVDAPANLCGNTVTVVGALNPAFGNHCGNTSGHPSGHQGQTHPDEPRDSDGGHGGNPGTPGGHGGDHGGNPGTPGGHGGNSGTPGGNSATPGGNPGTPGTPGTGTGTPVGYPGTPSGSGTGGELAATGSDGFAGAAVPLAGGMLLAGALLYRRARNAA
ncbi:chaplin [Streptomyces sp. G-G2]|uniref:chaplin n=1 Tax=Streptomyces sp. G-G2 TaxID=3046201 RepID=UPI0024BAAB7A|nr:chaplin [Streptomyces sp. G-G2]MDJ0381594.1 chaplin [Streptomyces sp. G-G2]